MLGMALLHARAWTWTLGIAVGLAWWLASLWWLARYSFAASPTPENRLLKLVLSLFVLVPAWLALVALHGQERGRWWVLLAIVVVWAADTGAYVCGRLFGKRKLAPRISPGKTWAGVYGALVLGALVCMFGGWLLGLRQPHQMLGMLTLGLATVAAAVVGDLIESLLKRQAEIKDSGTLFPGHGGLLDRMDSVLAALPLFFVGKLLLGL